MIAKELLDNKSLERDLSTVASQMQNGTSPANATAQIHSVVQQEDPYKTIHD